MKCDVCDNEVTKPAGPALRERFYLERNRRRPYLHVMYPRVCSVECHEVDLAAYYLNFPGPDPDRFAMQMSSSIDVLRYATKDMAKAMVKMGDSFDGFATK